MTTDKSEKSKNALSGGTAFSSPQNTEKATVRFDCAFPGGNVRIFDFDSRTGVVQLDSDFRDSVPDQFWTYFRVRGAGGRKLVFKFTGEGPFRRPRVSRAGMAYSIDEGKTWGWTSPETDHADCFGFSFDFPANADSVRFATTIPYLGADLDACLAAHPNLRRTTLTLSRKGRKVPLVTVGPEDAKLAFAVTARHHALEATANWVMEGMMEAAAAETPDGKWIRGNLRCLFVPFMDFDGVEDGDPGKNRRPHDPNRDYIAELYPEVKAFKALIRSETAAKRLVFFDLHAPQVRGSDERPAHDNLFTMGPPPEMEHYWNDYRQALIEATKDDPIRYFGTWDQKWGERYNVPAKDPGEMKSNHWVLTQPNILWTANCWEFGYGRCGGIVSREGLRGLGRRMMNILARQLATLT